MISSSGMPPYAGNRQTIAGGAHHQQVGLVAHRRRVREIGAEQHGEDEGLAATHPVASAMLMAIGVPTAAAALLETKLVISATSSISEDMIATGGSSRKRDNGSPADRRRRWRSAPRPAPGWRPRSAPLDDSARPTSRQSMQPAAIIASTPPAPTAIGSIWWWRRRRPPP